MRDEYPSKGVSGKILVKEVEALVSEHAEAFARRISQSDSDLLEGKNPIARGERKRCTSVVHTITST